MKIVWFLVLAILLAFCLLACVPSAEAGSCGVPYIAPYTSTYVAPVKVIKEVVAVPTYVPIAVYPIVVPSYAASYNPGVVATPAAKAPVQAAPAQASPCQETKALTAAVLKVLERLEALEKRGVPGAPVPPPPPTPGTPKGPGAGDPFNPGAGTSGALRSPGVLSAKCAQCHQRGNESKGGNFVLLERDGSAVKLDDVKLLAVQRMSYQKKMPPQRSGIAPLTDEELGEVVAWALSQR